MLPVNLLNALKEYALAQRTLPSAAVDAVPKPGQQFELGQKLQGSVQAQVAPNIFKVNVSGQLVQMQLPQTIRSGDTVALQVISLLPRLTFSMVNSANPLSTPEQLGATARMLSSLSQQSADKAYVRGAQSAPLWEATTPPESKQLAGLLHEALGNSGLFYESHQAQWLGGERSTAQLMHEPQNLSPEQAKAVVADPPANKAAGTNNNAGTTVLIEGAIGKAAIADDLAHKGAQIGDAAVKAVITDSITSKVASMDNASGKGMIANEVINQAVATGDLSAKVEVAGNPGSKAAMMWDAASKTAMVSDNDTFAVSPRNSADSTMPNQSAATSLPESKSQGIPPHLQPLVQQQLNALETRQMMWQGNVWPGQDMQWEVHEQAPQTPSREEQRQWVTQIQLDLPNLGAVAATLRFNSAGLSLTLNADTPQTRAVLGNASTRLVSALSDAGIPVLSTQVTHEPQNIQP